jgi:hypothetical protein
MFAAPEAGDAGDVLRQYSRRPRGLGTEETPMNKPRTRGFAALISMVAILAAVMVVAAPTASAAKPSGSSALTAPITGNVTDALGGTGAFAGTFTLTKFTSSSGQLFAVGTLTGTLTDSLGNVIGTVTQSITLPVSNITGSCQILHLVLGPLDLNLLGLQVHLNQVVLDITAQSGPGNLLGNLLCGIAGLLDGSNLTGLVNALNQIIRLL